MNLDKILYMHCYINDLGLDNYILFTGLDNYILFT